MKNSKLSVALAVYNEEDNIAKCLKSIMDIAREIIIVDGSSTDKTAAIAKKHGAKVITEPNRINFHINKQIAIDACKGEWVLQLDADERVSPELSKEIKLLTKGEISNKSDAYYIKRTNFFLGRWMKKGGMYPDPVIRLFKNGKAKLPQKNVHELMNVDGEIGWLDNDLLHIADPTFSRYLRRSNRYTTLEAENYLKVDPGTNIIQILNYFSLKPTLRFLQIYLRHKGFMDGFPGFIFAVYSGLHITTSYIKYWEKKKNGNVIDIKTDWD